MGYHVEPYEQSVTIGDQRMEQSALSFQEIILRLQQYWGSQGCVIMQPYDSEVGAGTFHTATTLRSLGP